MILLFGERLKQLRKKVGITQVNLAKQLNVAQATIAMWETGKNEPDFESIKNLSLFFKVTPNYFLGIPESTSDVKSNAIKIPVLGKIPAGIAVEAIEDILDYEEVPADWGRGGKEYFALKIQGDSMSPKYLENDVVIFLKTNSPDISGCDCAVIVNGDEATFKKVLIYEKRIVLQPINTNGYEPVFFSNKEVNELPVTIIGVAKEIRRKI